LLGQKSILLTSKLSQFVSNHPHTFSSLCTNFGDAFLYHTRHISSLRSHFNAHRRQLTNPSQIHESLKNFQKSEILNVFVALTAHFPDEYELQNYFPCLWKCCKYVCKISGCY